MNDVPENEFLKRFEEIMSEAWPFKRVQVPQHLIDRYNKEKNVCVTEMAVTIDKDATVSDEEIWNLITSGVIEDAEPIDPKDLV